MKKFLIIFLLILSLAPALPAQRRLIYNKSSYPMEVDPALKALYRKTSKQEQEILRPEADDLRKYVDFLQTPDSGLVRLFPNDQCAENTKIVNVGGDCLKFSMPGAGASYSFRVKDYRIQRLADLTFTNGGFIVTGSMIHGILTRIGDVPLEQVNLQTKGLKYLLDFQPAADYDQAKKMSDDLVKGVIKDDFIYRRGLNAKENTTYVLRSVAYRGTLPQVVQNVTYNELSFDRREDIIIAFRIARRSEDGSVTLIWKKLAEKESPKIERKKVSGRK